MYMKQKNGISLIVLVVVIIVMLIISGAVIISLTNSNVIDMGEQAVQKHNQKAVEEAFSSVTQGSDWNTGIPVEITYLQTATE